METNKSGNFRGMNKTSQDNLRKDFTRAERQANGSKGAQVTNEIKRKKIERANSKDYAWEEYGIKWLEEIDECGDIKLKADVLKSLLPTDKQTNEILGSLGIEKIFVTPEEMNKVDNHIDDVINDGLEL